MPEASSTLSGWRAGFAMLARPPPVRTRRAVLSKSAMPAESMNVSPDISSTASRGQILVQQGVYVAQRRVARVVVELPGEVYHHPARAVVRRYPHALTSFSAAAMYFTLSRARTRVKAVERGNYRFSIISSCNSISVVVDWG